MKIKYYKKFKQLIIVLLIALLTSCNGESSNGNDNIPAEQIHYSGEIDLTFGTDGIVITEESGNYDVPQEIISQQDDLILVAGESFDGANSSFVVMRYSHSGVLDETYGDYGKATVLITIGGGSTSLAGAVQQSDGKIILAGMSYNGTDIDIVLVRLNTDGTPDSSFGAGGVYRSDVGTNECAYAIALQEDEKILIGGFIENEIDNDLDFLITRYTADGTIDSDFGTEGYVKTPLPSNLGIRRICGFTALAISDDGSIIATGLASILYQTHRNGKLAIVRYSSSGLIDTEFGTPGLTIEGSANWPNDMLIQEDNKIVIAASEYDPGSNPENFSLIRFEENGSIDLSFGISGIAQAAPGEDYAYASALAIDSNGRFIAVGQTFQDDTYSFGLARFNTDGILDSTFGDGGMIITEVGIDSSNANSASIQPDGKIIVAGGVDTEGGFRAFGIVRYYP